MSYDESTDSSYFEMNLNLEILKNIFLKIFFELTMINVSINAIVAAKIT